MTTLKSSTEKVLLVILDGYGVNENLTKNAIREATKPNLDKLFKDYPNTLIEAGGISVGLPKGVSGNSEVGHMNLGAGMPVRQDLVRINEAISNDTFSELEGFKNLLSSAKKNSGRIHIMGLLSDGGVHSHIEHIKKSIQVLSKEKGIEVFFHAFMDGRDTKKNVGEKFLVELSNIEGCKFASMQGRSIGMDRDRRWEKIKSCYDTFIGSGSVTNKSPIEYLENEYNEGRFDEFVAPVLFSDEYAMKEGDSVFFINFRPDRAVQISLAMNEPNFSEFERSFIPSHFLCMTPYIPDEVELPILFNKEKIKGGLSEHISSLGHKQFKIAETEKYAHVTFFFNGGEKKPFPKEEHVLVPSPKEVKTYDEKPEMSAPEITSKLMEALERDYTFLLVNFANSDMVGHTGNFEAAVKAIEALDDCVGKLMKKCEEQNITMFLTADHGNADQMVYEDGTPHTSHTGAPVPFAAYRPDLKGIELKINNDGHALKDVAPTILHALGIELPKNFTGKSIFQ